MPGSGYGRALAGAEASSPAVSVPAASPAAQIRQAFLGLRLLNPRRSKGF
ncbi:hypothetical protein [Streptomyces sp. NBC_01304]|nr:hypothetical protein OG430_09580 [Streptomyces sp. NBC_01304]